MNDVQILRDLARQYAAVAAHPVQEERRRLWRDHNSLRPMATPIYILTGMWDIWCRQAFGDDVM